MEKQQIVLPTPTPQQKKFLDLANSEQLYGGAKGGGKTFVGCMKAIMLSAGIPGNRGMICRLNWPQLRDSTLETFKTVCPPEIREWSASNREHTIRTIDGRHSSTILWRSMGDPDDFEKAKGTELGWLWIDEPTEVPLETYLMLRAQLRWKTPGGTFPPYMSFLTSNPEPGWVKDRFITNMVKGGVFIPALPTDNPHLPPGLVRDLREQHPQIWVEKYLNGSWEVGEGSLFPELGDIHVMEDIDHTGMDLIGCIDHATTGVTCYLQMGVDKDENLYVLEEYYKKDRLISEHAAAMRFLMEKYGDRNEHTLIDPSTEAKTIQGNYDLYSVQDEYRRNGIHARAARRSSISIGIEVLQELVHPLPGRRHPRTQQPPSPRIFIQRSKCPNFWRELSELRSEVDPETGRIKYIGSDHAVDCCRYIAMSRPGAAKRSPQADNYVLQPNEPISNIAARSFARWDKKFGNTQTSETWFPRPN